MVCVLGVCILFMASVATIACVCDRDCLCDECVMSVLVVSVCVRVCILHVCIFILCACL